MEALIVLIQQAILCAGLISGIPLLFCSAAGLLIAVLQAATSVQEQSSLYAVKLTALIMTFVVGGGILSNALFTFVRNALGSLSTFATAK